MFAAIIVIISCYNGFTCEGGAEGVGKATTSAVVISMVLILVLDYFLSAFLVHSGSGSRCHSPRPLAGNLQELG